VASIEQTIDVEVPVRTAYNQWTKFEEFPQFMNGIEEVRQVDETTLHWKAQVAGREREWVAKVTEQTPDQRVAWKDEDGKTNAGVVTFHKLEDGKTRVAVQMDWEAEGVVEKVGEKLGFDERTLKGDLERFKEFIESRGSETGAYRGEVTQDPTT
jgi:uncharacterized membrane protein